MAYADDGAHPSDRTHGVSAGNQRRHNAAVFAAVFATVAVGFVIRAMWFWKVFPGEGGVKLGVDDAMFHARRALYSFHQFPAVLEFDWYVAYPAGALAPLPPLFDWLLAGVALLFGNDLHTFEIVAAWVSPVLGALFSVPAFWIARSIAGPGLGIAAAALVAVLPSGILITRIGNCDHHAAVALIAGCWLASSMSEVNLAGQWRSRRARVQILLHAIVIATMLLTWSGSLLYLVLAEGTRIAGILCYDGRPQRFLRVGASLVLAALPIGVWLLFSQTPMGGPLTSQTLSWLHEIALLAMAGYVSSLALLERWRPSASPMMQWRRALLLAASAMIPALLVTGIRESVLLGLGFVGKQDLWAIQNAEQTPLFMWPPEPRVVQPTVRFGFFAYFVPLTPIIVGYGLWRARIELREHFFILFCWMTALCGLVLSQVRYGTDFAVPGAVVFAFALASVRTRLLGYIPGLPATAFVVLLAGAMLWPASSFYTTAAKRSWETLFSNRPRQELPASFRFADEVRRVTPETRGFLDAGRPEYSLMVPLSLGHLFSYRARRPIPANNLGPYLNMPLYLEVDNFYRTASSAKQGIEILERISARYIVTAFRKQTPELRTFADTLHRSNGSTKGETVGRFRLITQSESLTPLGNPQSKTGQGRSSFKLFEFVKGAVLVVSAEPGERASAAITLETPTGRRKFVKFGLADATGVARLRIPYPSARHAANVGTVSVESSWLVRSGDNIGRVEVREKDILEGRDILVDWRRN